MVLLEPCPNGSTVSNCSQIVLVSDLTSGNAEIEQTIAQASGGLPLCTLKDQDEALRRIEVQEFDTVFCASRSGALASTLFLNEVWRRNPNSNRFLLDGFADAGTVVRCLLGGHYFLQTPLTRADVGDALLRAESIKVFVKNDRIRTLLARMRTLPTKPTVYLDVTRELRAPEPSAERVAGIISKDLGISTKLIQVVNSPYYGLNQSIDDVSDAILFLGMETTASVVMSIEAFSRFDKVKPLYFTADRVWKHSQALAETVKKICQIARQGREVSGPACLAARLHDIGKLAFAENFPEEYDALVQSADKRGGLLYELETERFGASHADAGAYLLAVWGLPIPVVSAVSSHHAGFGAFNEMTAATAVHLAEQMFGSRAPIDEIIRCYPPEVGLRGALDQLRLIAPLRMKGDISRPGSIPSENHRGQLDPVEAILPPAASQGGIKKALRSLKRLWS